MDFAEYDRKVRKMKREEIEFAIRDAREAIECHGENEGYYQDEVHILVGELRRRGKQWK